MKVVLTGASGFIGKRVVRELQAGHHDVHLLGRKRIYPEAPFTSWDALGDAPPAADAFNGANAVIHLAGTPLAQRWTEEAKRRIRKSRIEGTRLLIEALRAQSRPPAVLVCASAIGFYGSRGDEVLTEKSGSGQGFLAELCTAWESAADEAIKLGVRVVKLRIGVVLGSEGGALPRMLPAFRLGAGGRLGSGRQWMSWIHIEDLVQLICLPLEQSSLSGVFNATAPNPVRNAHFTTALGHALHRPTVMMVPGFALKTMLGEMSEVLLGSQRVVPEATQNVGFRFRHPQLEPALRQILTPVHQRETENPQRATGKTS